MLSLPYAVLNFDSAASLLHLSRGLAPYAFLPYAVLNFDSAASLLHLSRGLAPYNDNKKCLPESKLSSDTFIIVARLITITKALVSLYITDSMFLSVSAVLRVYLSR